MSTLFVDAPIGSLIFYDQSTVNSLPDIKIDSTHVREPSGRVVSVKPSVIVYVGHPKGMEVA